MNQNADSPIYTTAQFCSKLFGQILKPTEYANEGLDIVGELRGRFCLWAAYVGAFAAPKASLDARLSGHSDIKEMVLELLDMVQMNLEWEINTLSKSKSTNQFSFDSRQYGVNEETTPGFSSASAAIDRLLILATAIRRSARQSHKLRINGNNDQVESFCCVLVRSKFPHATDSLCDQLGASIYTRGTSLQYIQLHNRKLAHQRDNIDSSLADTKQEDETGSNVQEIEKGQQTPDLSPNVQPTMVAPETLPSFLSPSAVIRFNNSKRKPSGSIASKGSAAENKHGDNYYYPPKPQQGNDERYLSCNLCGDPLATSRLTEDVWKAHVDQDLEPYVCISEECREPFRYFTHMREWMDHMQARHSMTWAQKVHTERWYCDIGHENPQDFEFLKKSEFLNHLETKHSGQLTKSKLQGRARRNRRIATREPFVCPLCDCIPEDIKPHIHEKPYKQLSQHIGRHLKSLAFLSLSYIEDNTQDRQSLAESSHTTTSSKNNKFSYHSPKNRYAESVDDVPETQVMADGTRRIDGDRTEGPQDFPDEPTPLKDPEYWDFVPRKDLEFNLELLRANLQRRHSESDNNLLSEPIKAATTSEVFSEARIVEIEPSIFMSFGIESWRIDATVFQDRVEEVHYTYDPVKNITRMQKTTVWQVDEILDRGGFGTVRVEKNKESGRVRVVKKIWTGSDAFHYGIQTQIEFLKPKFKEAAVFVDFYGWFKDQSYIYVAMEYLPLQDLESNVAALSGGKIPETEARDIAKQILSGLEIMHAESFVHRNLDPTNILVAVGRPRWWVKISGFGFCEKLTEANFKPRKFVAGYMALEMFTYLETKGSISECTNAVDIWAAGCITYRLMAGIVPFPSVVSLIQYCNDGNPFPFDDLLNDGITDSACAFLFQVLAPNPQDRPSATQALQHEWILSKSDNATRCSDISKPAQD